PARGHGFNYFDRAAIPDPGDGAGFSFYAAVWPILQEYPGPNNFQLGLPSTWMTPRESDNLPPNFYNTIEGGLGWWHDTRFGTETPKFIMGGVAFDFNQWANGVGAGSSELLPNGQRDWTEASGKYGVAQLSPYLLWPPDGLNMEQGANGEYLGYGYHPLPITDPLATTYGFDFPTGNQCWTLFLNTTNFKGPATFFLPTFWTETVLENPSLAGLFLDSRPSDKNPAFAMEYAESPALIGTDANGDHYARILPLVFPKTEGNRSELIRDVRVYDKEAKWYATQDWFNGGTVATTPFQLSASEPIYFELDPGVDGHIGTDFGMPFEAMINYDPYAEKVANPDGTAAGFSWDPDVVENLGANFAMPTYYRLATDNLWTPIQPAEVPTATGLLNNTPAITQRPDDLPYLTPREPDCHLQDPLSPWNSPGPSAGPFKVVLGDGSELTYYWYRFIDQPAIVHADLPAAMRQNMQERIEKIHTHWSPTDAYLPAPTGGTLVGLDPGLLVHPPADMEVGYVPIVTRQELATTSTASDLTIQQELKIYPNPTSGELQITIQQATMTSLTLFNATGQLVLHQHPLASQSKRLTLTDIPNGIYCLKITLADGGTALRRIVKIN
ncbi:MAG: T9SS type A sorting domain-containing protein, partial [Bacteroidota bacterium]